MNKVFLVPYMVNSMSNKIKILSIPFMTKALTEIELFAVTSITHLSTLVYRLIFPESLILEFLFSAVPQYLTIVFLKSTAIIYLAFGTLLLVYLLLLAPKQQVETSTEAITVTTSGPVKDSVEVNSGLISNPRRSYIAISIDRTRFIIISCVAIAIFASDFSFYNSDKLGKSMGRGLKLMDIGVGSFVYNAGFFSAKADSQRKIKNILLASFLGILRYLSKAVFELGVEDAEFGTHMNFFFNLAILNLLSLIIDTQINFIIGFAMCLIHEYSLMFLNLNKLILETTRSNLIMANIEGIAFILPQMGMFLMASDIGKAAFSGKSSIRMVSYNIFFFVVLLLTRQYSLSYRRLHNLCFCMIIMALHTTHGILAGATSKVFKIKPFQLQRFASRHLLFILLWSNMFVALNLGLGKLLPSLKQIPNYISHGICIIYLLLVFYAPCKIARRLKGGNAQ